jgi:Polysaccharide pyruvyl transferase
LTRSRISPVSMIKMARRKLSSSSTSSSIRYIPYMNIVLGMGIIDGKAARISSSVTSTISRMGRVLGVRGPLTRDAFLAKQGINPEIIGDPGLFFPLVFHDEIQKIVASIQQQQPKSVSSSSSSSYSNQESNQSNTMKELCFISHEFEDDWYTRYMIEYQNITARAGKRGHGGDIYDIIPFIVTCKRLVSSSLHGIIFAHALSIPSLPIQVTNKLAGGNFKFVDYYHSIGVTSFMKRLYINESHLPSSKYDWIQSVNDYPHQPSFPIESNISRIYHIMKTIYQGT